MKPSKAKNGGVLGRSKNLPDQGDEMPPGQLHQSCPTASKVLSRRIRLSLPSQLASKWMSMPPRLREQVAGIVFGSFTEGLDLKDLAAVASELKMVRLAINNALQLALETEHPLDRERIQHALDRINNLLGEKRP